MKPVSDYLWPDECGDDPEGVSFFTIMARAQSLGQLAIGYLCTAAIEGASDEGAIDFADEKDECDDGDDGDRECTGDGTGVVLNPPNKSALRVWTKHDKIIVLAK